MQSNPTVIALHNVVHICYNLDMNKLRETYENQVLVLRKAAEDYYRDGSDSSVSDEEYDLTLANVTNMGETYGWTEHTDLATQVAGGVSMEAVENKVNHRTRMLSLAKAQDTETLQRFLDKMAVTKSALLVEPKLDGLALVAIYREGKLVQVATRGDSRIGQNVTARARKLNVKGLPKTISYQGELEIRGELFLTSEDFAVAQQLLWKRTKTREKCSEHKTFNCDKHRQYKNARNACSGMILTKDDTKSEGVTLTFATYDVIPISGEGLQKDSYTQLIALAAKEGFITTASFIEDMFDEGDDIPTKIEKFGKLKDTLNFPTDGIVVKIDKLSVRQALGNGEKTPYWAIAYKYEAEMKPTILRDIIRDVGRTGAITYVAVFDEVTLASTEVAKATLNNSRFIQEMDLRLGDTIIVRKANEIIPEVVGVDFSKRAGKTLTPYVAPTTCPECGLGLDTTTSIIWRCENDECAIANVIIHAVNRNNLDIRGLSEKLIEKMYDAKLITDVTDLYNLTVADIAGLDTGRVYSTDERKGEPILVGETTAKELYKNIQASKDRELHRIISSLGVRFLGNTFSRAYAVHFKSFEKFVNATVEELQEIDKVKDKAFAIREGLDKIQSRLDKYRAVGFTNMETVEEVKLSAALAGETVVVTGSVPGYGRNEVKELIAAHGGVAGGSVSGKTTLVVAPKDERDSTKAKKAISLGIAIITPEEFLAKLE